MSLKFTGVNKVMSNLNKALVGIKIKGTAGLIDASIIIRRDMDKRPPVIPVDFGNLRGSWFTTIGTRDPEPGGKFSGSGAGGMSSTHQQVKGEASGRAKGAPNPILIMGFSAGYSVFVHDIDWKKGKRPGSGPKFFESAIKRNEKKIIGILAGRIKF